ncbi:MAG: tRNA (adenosine(37)-N6)-threonylcarbamoyltransferase complex dimerization subunit type 1 TsaB [Cohaesibacter sp.]|nr:tRNA (adenosine(37)-N6)-threonylcarbamoyltransferase complex dimerization subunit type 1 TsaB [Cohaesibacter sp.]
MTLATLQERQICLAIDTALNACSLALAIRTKDQTDPIVICKSQAMERGHTENLMTMLEDLLREAQVNYCDLTSLAVTVGPGSFTGLRVGLSTMRALALALDLPLIGLSSLRALELTAREKGVKGPLCAAIDARRGQIYSQIFNGTAASEPKALSLNDLIAQVSKEQIPILIGSASEMIRKAMQSKSDKEEQESPPLPQIPDMGSVAKWALDQPKPEASPDPLYLRAPNAKPQVGKAIARA